ncbi:MAG TPA: hypothetical protein VFB27_13550 [Opitutaceae bacterium]|nr:hypothetical protein [Opitutaceae bacterium]
MRARIRTAVCLAILLSAGALAVDNAGAQGSSAGLWQLSPGATGQPCPLLVMEIYASGHGAAWVNGANQNPDPQLPDLEGRVKVTRGGHIEAAMSDPDGKDRTRMSLRGTFSASEMRVQASVTGKNVGTWSGLCVFKRNSATPVLAPTPPARS